MKCFIQLLLLKGVQCCTQLRNSLLIPNAAMRKGVVQHPKLMACGTFLKFCE